MILCKVRWGSQRKQQVRLLLLWLQLSGQKLWALLLICAQWSSDKAWTSQHVI